MVVLAFLVLYEIFYDAVVPSKFHPKWQYQLRVGVILAYLAGWIVGRTLLGLDVSFLSPEDDENRLGKHSLCKSRTRRNRNQGMSAHRGENVVK